MKGIGSTVPLSALYARVPNLKWDGIFGTSTGSIIGGLLAKPNPLTPDQIREWYYNDGPKIFSKTLFQSLSQLWTSKYSSAGLYSALQEALGESFMDACTTYFCCATTEADTVLPFWIDPTWETWPIWAACAASSSAETYFPSFKTVSTGRWIDGGNFANNPSRHAALWAQRTFPGEEFIVVHLGTGQPKENNPLPEGGAAQWAPIIFTDVSSLQDFESSRDARQIAPHYYRLDFTLDSCRGMDDASKGTLDSYVSAAQAAMDSQPSLMEEIATLLQKP